MFIDEMVDILEQYYEEAGFENYYEEVLKDLSEFEIRELYQEIFG